jgi:hypothetical protein
MLENIFRQWDEQKIVNFNGLSEDDQYRLLNLGFAPALDIFWRDGHLAINLDVYSELAA